VHNICLDVDRGIIKKSLSKNLPHMLEIESIKEMLEKIHLSQIAPIVKLAILFSLHTFLRPHNVRFLEWSEVDFDNKVIAISHEKMKMRKAHITPLSYEVIRLLKEAWKLNGHCQYVFLMSTGKVMSDMTMNRSLERMGYKDKQTTHGFRHTASTILNENIITHGVHSDAIERQMAHVAGGIRGVYNKAEYISERVKLMHWWSSFLCTLYTSQNHTT
jgi:integrase